MNLHRRVAAFVMDRKNLGAELAEALDANVQLQRNARNLSYIQQAARNLSHVATIRGNKIRELEDENRRLRENLVEMERLYTASCDDVRFLLSGQLPVRGEGQ